MPCASPDNCKDLRKNGGDNNRPKNAALFIPPKGGKDDFTYTLRGNVRHESREWFHRWTRGSISKSIFTTPGQGERCCFEVEPHIGFQPNFSGSFYCVMRNADNWFQKPDLHTQHLEFVSVAITLFRGMAGRGEGGYSTAATPLGRCDLLWQHTIIKVHAGIYAACAQRDFYGRC